MIRRLSRIARTASKFTPVLVDVIWFMKSSWAKALMSSAAVGQGLLPHVYMNKEVVGAAFHQTWQMSEHEKVNRTEAR